MNIEDYALIGDTETAALVGRDGSIDWLYLPRSTLRRASLRCLAPGAMGAYSLRRYRTGRTSPRAA